jgi:5'-3' exonuclease
MKTLLVDGNSLLKNSFEATISTEEYKKNFNGIYLFLLKLRIILDSDSYSHLKIVFDGEKSGSLRREVYPEYKLKRHTKEKTEFEKEKSFKFNYQKTALKEYLSYFCNVYEDKCVEADDIIAEYIRRKSSNERVTIVTGDFDILSQISSMVDIYYLNKSFKYKTRVVERYEKEGIRKNLIIDHKNFKKIFGFPYENIILIKTICGDNSDEIKNVKGVKETSLFNCFPDIQKKPLKIEDILEQCKIINESDTTVLKKIKQNILEGITDGLQGKDILKINSRIVDLSNEEFITEECINNLNEIGFFSKEKFVPKDSTLMVEKMKESGLLDFINYKSKNIKYFFKPFLKTFNK